MRTLTEEDIRTRAYKLWKAAGEHNTKMDAFWYQAEKELLADRASENGGANELTHGFASVAAEIVQDNDIAGAKRRQKNLRHVGPKALAVDRPLDKPRRIDPVMAQCRQEGHGLPTTMRNLGGQPVAARRPSPQWSHIGPGPSLVDEDQPLRFDAVLILCPLDAPTRHVGTIALASHHAFF